MHALELYKPDIGEPPCFEPGKGVEPLSTPERDILIRVPNWLGDAVMSLPALYQIRNALPPERKLYVLTRQELATFWKTVPWLDNVFSSPGKRSSAWIKREIRKHKVNSIVLPNSFGSALDVMHTGSSRRVGRGGRFRKLVLTDVLPPWQPQHRNSKTHQLTHYLEIASAVFPNIEWTASFPPLDPGVNDVFRELGFDQKKMRHSLTIAPGAAYGPAKQWPLEYFTEVAKAWRDDGKTVVTVGTEREKPAGEKLAETTGAVNLCGKTTLPQLMAVLGNSSVCLTNDSGGMHLAAAMACRGVAVFGSTNPDATGPVGGSWIVLKDTDCNPCFARRCKREDEFQYTCLKAIKPPEVIEALTRVLQIRSAVDVFKARGEE